MVFKSHTAPRYKFQHVWADSLKEMGATMEAYFSHFRGSEKEVDCGRLLMERQKLK